jgi:putative ABC transport system permease protein
MTAWLIARRFRRAPRRLVLGAVGVAFPVAIVAATLFFLNLAVASMTRVALAPVEIEQRALATSLKVDMTAIGRQLEAVPGVSNAERFAAADVVVRVPGSSTGATARLFAIDPSYLDQNPWVRVVDGSLDQGALLDQALRASPGFAAARRVSIELPGGGGGLSLTLPAPGTADLRGTLSTWFAIPTGEVQGDVALVPRAIVIDYQTFERRILPALKRQLGTATPVLNPGLTDLPPVSLESHIAVDNGAYPSDPGAAATWSKGLQHVLQRQAAGDIVVADDAYEPLTEAANDASNAKTLFLLLGIPGALVAAALGLAVQSALTEAQRREDALLRLRGATDRQLIGLAVAEAGIAWALGSVLGLLVAAGAVGATTGQSVWQDVPAGALLTAILVAVVAGALATGARIVRLIRAGRRTEAAERRQLERGWQPTWRRAGLDFAAIGVGVAILLIDLASGGLKQTPIEAAQGSTLALHFYVLLAPIFLWIGITLLAIRILLARSARWARADGRPLPSWRGAALRWLSRRPGRTAVAVALGALAIGFGTEVLTFVATYRDAKQAEDQAAFGSDLRLTPGDPAAMLPPLGPDVAAVSPIRLVPVRADTDRKTVMALDLATYSDAATAQPRLVSGGGLEAIANDPNGVLIAPEIATDFEIAAGDPLPLTLFPDDPDLSRNLKFHVAGVFRSFPPTEPVTEMVVNAAGLPPYLQMQPDFYLARDAPGATPSAVADELRQGALRDKFSVATIADQQQSQPRSLTALNLGPLSDIEAVGAALIAAIGVAVLGAFFVFERRREFAILEAVGADPSQIRTGPAQEGIVAVLASVLIGVPLGLALALISVRVLGLFFSLPPPLLVVPVAGLIAMIALVVVVSGIALWLALAAVRRTAAATVLRGP